MQPASGSPQPFKDFDERGVLEEPAVVNGLVDPADFLAHHPPGAEVEVADFRVAHDPGRKPHVLARCAQHGMGILLPQPVEIRRLRQQNGVGIAAGGDAPTVQDDQCDGSIHVEVRTPAVSMRVPDTRRPKGPL